MSSFDHANCEVTVREGVSWVARREEYIHCGRGVVIHKIILKSNEYGEISKEHREGQELNLEE